MRRRECERTNVREGIKEREKLERDIKRVKTERGRVNMEMTGRE
jgi:hypothetical protein